MGDDGSIGPEEDKIINNIFRKGKDIPRNEKIKGLIERFQFKIKKKIETILLDMEEQLLHYSWEQKKTFAVAELFI